jgi:hypothetical protein
MIQEIINQLAGFFETPIGTTLLAILTIAGGIGVFIKDKQKDTTAVEKNKKSKIDLETRKGLDISVKENEDSDVKIK